METINIYDKNGVKTPMEIVLVFKLDGYDSNYIIYRELDKSKNYLAKYTGDKIIDLDTNISKKEFELCNKVFEKIKNN